LQIYTYLSSSMVREVAGLGGDVRRMVPPAVAAALRALEEKMRNS
jgi:phosphopantetheine adenylyltransferase